MKKIVNIDPSWLKCGTHTFYVRKAYVKGNLFINVGSDPSPSNG